MHMTFATKIIMLLFSITTHIICFCFAICRRGLTDHLHLHQNIPSARGKSASIPL